MTFTEIKTAIKELCNLTSTEADTRVGKSVNRHYKRVTSSLGLDPTRFVTRSQSTTNGVRTVTFTSIEKIDRVIDATDSDAIRELTLASVDELRSEQPGTSEPTRYAIQSVTATSVTILLDTLPQTTYSLQADGKATLSDLSGSDVPAIAESYHDILTFSVVAEELLRKEKVALAREYATGDEENPGRAEKLLAEYRFEIADQNIGLVRQGESPSSRSGGSGGGGGSVGGTAYTQSALLTFDRGAATAPFAVAQADAPYVANLGAEFLGNITTDRLIGRDTAGTGETEQLTVGGGIEFTGTGIQTSAFTGDVTKLAGGTAQTIPNNTVTYAKMQDVSAASRIIGRGSAAGSGDPEELTLSTGLSLSTTTLTATLDTILCPWTSVSHTAGDFTAQSGNWTVDSADLKTFIYRVIGKMMLINVVIEGSDVSATPTDLRILIPNSKAVSKKQVGAAVVTDAATNAAALWVCDPAVSSGTLIQIFKVSGSYTATSSDNTNVYVSLVLEIA